MSELHGDIRDRIDAALEKMTIRQENVRAIYLCPLDRKALDRAQSKEFGLKLHVCGYRDHIVRGGAKSVIYSTHGVGTAVPKKLSHRVGVAA